MSRLRRASFLAVFVFSVGLPPSFVSAEPYRYVESKSGPAELKYVDGVPVLTLQGGPEEIGEQFASLVAKPADRLSEYPVDFLKVAHLDSSFPMLVRTGAKMLDQFPADHLKEFETGIKAGKLNRDKFIVANTIFDIKKIFGCSALIVDAEQSATGKPLFGRNLDFPTLGYLNEYSLVLVCKPTGKHAFASITFPGFLGCLSGMNNAGLCLGILEVSSANDGSARFDAEGVPYALLLRRVLEECSTVAEAEKLLRAAKRTTRFNLAICDPKGGAVFEVTPKNVEVRPAEAGLCAVTNHFRTKELATSTECWRYPRLAKAVGPEKLDLSGLAARLNAVNQGEQTLQTMIFEPATLTLHLAIGKCPTSMLPMKKLELAPLLQGESEKK
jgi:hypothetical protein